MFIKRTVAKHGEKTYVNHLLVESVNTAAGPRHKVICNLGHLEPGPKEDWLDLADRIQAALGGQPSLFPDPRVEDAVRLCRTRQAKQSQDEADAEDALAGEAAVPEVVAVKPAGVQIQDIREVGPLHVGHQLWQRLEVDAVLKAVGLSIPARQLTEVMTLNRLIEPASELAMVEWAGRVAVADVLGTEVSKLNEDKFYRNLDTLHGKRIEIEFAVQGVQVPVELVLVELRDLGAQHVGDRHASGPFHHRQFRSGLDQAVQGHHFGQLPGWNGKAHGLQHGIHFQPLPELVPHMQRTHFPNVLNLHSGGFHRDHFRHRSFTRKRILRVRFVLALLGLAGPAQAHRILHPRIREQRRLAAQGRLDAIGQVEPVLLGPRLQVAEIADHLVARAGSGVHRLDQQVVDVGLLAVLGNRTLDEHGDTNMRQYAMMSRY